MRRVLVALMWLTALPVSAAPYRPADDGLVLERLPVAGAERQLLRKMQADMQSAPDLPGPAMALARRYIQLGRSESDPRHFAHAEALLAPWLQGKHPPPEALVLRATILQNRHDFKAALADLRGALLNNPRLAQAWLTLAAVQEAQGDYAGALHSCLALSRHADALLAGVCANSALSFSGQAEASYRRLSVLAERMRGETETSLWVEGMLAEMAERLDLPLQAEKRYASAIGSGTANAYLKAAYADFLLAQNRPEAARALLAGQMRSDPLLLRLTLAEQQLGDAGFTAHAETLRARFAAAKARGDTTHQGEEARFALLVEQQASRALALAQSNWRVQREPRDALILLQAALAAGQPDAARPVRDFIRQTGLEDVRLQKLLDKLSAKST